MPKIEDNITIKFAGDSGDGMQLTGTQFTNNTAFYGNDFATFPNYPAEIRAPQGTIHGVSGFQINFGTVDIQTPGDHVDVLVAMNAAAIKDSLHTLKKGGVIIVDKSGFDKKNLRLAGYNPEENLLENSLFDSYRLIDIDVTEMTKQALETSSLDAKDKLRSKNMFVLGLLLWMYNRDIETVVQFLTLKFNQKKAVLDANISVLQSGYYYGETAELSAYKTEVKPASKEKGLYRNIMGNQATALGLMAAANKVKRPLFYGTYPITPASDILHELVKHTKHGVECFQAEDEIAAVSSAIGASFGGALGTTGTSGPGLALKSEAINLALMLELPLVVVNVQRAGPSTGMPTKTEQSDLLIAMFGRNGDSPLPIIAAHSPAHCFMQVYWAAKIAVEYMTPVIFLSDGYLANGSEPWKFPQMNDLPNIEIPQTANRHVETYLPYNRNEDLVRDWVVPGTKGKAHRLGGLEKEECTGNVSYVPSNHQLMTDIRLKKVANVGHIIPKQTLNSGKAAGDLLIIGWGNTYGAIKAATLALNEKGYQVGHVQIDFINPFPENMEDFFKPFKKILVPELNTGQLVKLLQMSFPQYNFETLQKVQGIPFKVSDIIAESTKIIGGEHGN